MGFFSISTHGLRGGNWPEGEIGIQAKHKQAHSQLLFAYASRDTLLLSLFDIFVEPPFFLFYGRSILSLPFFFFSEE